MRGVRAARRAALATLLASSFACGRASDPVAPPALEGAAIEYTRHGALLAFPDRQRPTYVFVLPADTFGVTGIGQRIRRAGDTLTWALALHLGEHLSSTPSDSFAVLRTPAGFVVAGVTVGRPAGLLVATPEASGWTIRHAAAPRLARLPRADIAEVAPYVWDNR